MVTEVPEERKLKPCAESVSSDQSCTLCVVIATAMQNEISKKRLFQTILVEGL